MAELQSTILKNSVNLKGYWRLEGDSTDSSGNANNGTDTSITYNTANGVFGQGAGLNGTLTTGSKIDFGTSATLDFASAFSIGGWIKVTSELNDTALISKISGSPFNGYMIYLATRTPALFINGSARVTAATTLAIGTLYHIVCVWTGTEVKIYINGRMDASAAYSTAPTSSGQTFSVGYYTSSANRLPANLDDLFALDIALSADQIKELYEGRYVGEGHPEASLVAGFHLNGNSTDFSGNNNHGTDTAITYSLANGKFNQGGGFNGSTSGITLGTSTSLNPAVITISCWVKPTATQNYKTIVARWDTVGGINTRSFNLSFGYLTNNRVAFTVSSDGTDAGTHSAVDPIAMTNDIWYHVVAIYDGSTIFVYKNGNLVASTAHTTMKSSPNNRTSIGCQAGRVGDALGSFITGAIDEVQIYNVAKDARWVRQQYAWGMGKYI